MAYRKSELVGLRDEVKRLADEGRALNPRIAAAFGDARHEARQVKGGIGYRARVALLAYALLRDVPYESLERTTRDTDWSRARLRRDLAAFLLKRRPGPLPDGDEEEAVSDWMRAPSAEAAQ